MKFGLHGVREEPEGHLTLCSAVLCEQLSLRGLDASQGDETIAFACGFSPLAHNRLYEHPWCLTIKQICMLHVPIALRATPSALFVCALGRTMVSRLAYAAS